ncbi:MAG: SDR family oxidoreductase [Deltaproteobacteria bacterium]|nr:SDR family oxidoreductase [Deltaproteobacteria bacterium]
MSFLGLEGKSFFILGVKNRKSVAFHIARLLEAEGATLVLSARNEERRAAIASLFPAAQTVLCDVRAPRAASSLRDQIQTLGMPLDGMVHSIAFARYESAPGEGPVSRPFHETPRADFLDAIQVSTHSLFEISDALKDVLRTDASVVAISISTTSMAAENYGYMAPVKAALDAAIPFLAKSFSRFSRVRFNAVCAGLLKTSSSAGIPGYVDSYLHAEKATLRKRGLDTKEVANAAAFLLSPSSSGINAQRLVIDAGMGVNYFDEAIVKGGRP